MRPRPVVHETEIETETDYYGTEIETETDYYGTEIETRKLTP